MRVGAPLVALLFALLVLPPAVHLACTAWRDHGEEPAPAPGTRDDASHMDATVVGRVVAVPADDEAALAAIRAALAEARASGLVVSIAGARHSMGGQTLAPGAIVLDMLTHDRMTLDAAARVLTVQGGATWHAVLRELDRHALSVAVMQSNNVFSVGGSISVNCHGWEPAHPPIASSVRALRIVTADGELVRCSREERRELFGLVLGGYGLFGVILDVELEVVPNEVYRAERFVVPVAEYWTTLEREVLAEPARAGLAFGRLNVSPHDFLGEAILTVFRPQPGETPPPLAEPDARELERLVFRGQIGSDYGKTLRWTAERLFGGLLLGSAVTRNQLLDEDDHAVLENRDPTSTEILHEYFVPPEGFLAFVEALRAAVPRHGADLLNVTVRDLRADETAFLRYADRTMLALVLLFHQERSAEADARMEPLTRELIDAALAAGGRYYLPYRLHATRAQLEAAYPMAREFFGKKRQYDPGELFQNRFYQTYGR